MQNLLPNFSYNTCCGNLLGNNPYGTLGMGFMPFYMPANFMALPQMPILGGFNLGIGFNKPQNQNTFQSTSTTAVSGSAKKIVQIAQQELARGVKEIGRSNDSEDIRRYKHGAKNNAQWCAYFTSYCCEQAGAKPFSYTGASQGIKKQAIKAGHYAQKNSGYTPKPGDLAIWTKTASTGHIGIVEKVYADGSFDTIEGNSSDRVKRNHYKSQSAVGSTFNGFAKMSEWLA